MYKVTNLKWLTKNVNDFTSVENIHFQEEEGVCGRLKIYMETCNSHILIIRTLSVVL